MKIWMLILGMTVVFITAGCQPEAAEQKESSSVSTEAVDATLRDNEVVRIGDEVFLDEDLTLYTLMQQVKIELLRHQDEQQLSGDALADRQEYWEDQMAYLDNYNVQLNHLIELNAMALLAEEKNYFIPAEKIESQLGGLKEKIAEAERAAALVEAYGQENFNQAIRPYLEASMLRDRVSEDLLKELEQENPDASEQELNYLLAQRFEGLYRDQLESLEIDVRAGR
ncbi:hypothetical protein SAMN05421743_13020 [Thalassobacillus cyri]|uniref:SurA N-terminal domain-containing protein n=1 Tax=Thalassobacillus cyri TaxID=571932 RepID=A0A1H4HGN2_9BACI|nr:hypothetical protein [Thalassobacillus cyri]SEB21019.1 hypothetical protein SAMN05421743_13020 [Thalassobacillus cyri]